ncbi:MAG: DUF3047 domain-containing protein [Methylotenera sp.]
MGYIALKEAARMLNIWNRNLKKSLCSLLLLLPIIIFADGERIDVARFSQGETSGWKTKVFSGETRYSTASSSGRTALHASSSKAASGLFRKINIDLRKTPVLHWSWKVDNVLVGTDERTKAGDDYPARVYVVFSGGAAFWRTRAINYVWSNNQPVNSHWPNAFTKNAQMIAVQSGPERVGEWVKEQHDVLADYRKLFGTEPNNVEAVAIMTDTDNTGATASAWYGDMWFSAQ